MRACEAVEDSFARGSVGVLQCVGRHTPLFEFESRPLLWRASPLGELSLHLDESRQLLSAGGQACVRHQQRVEPLLLGVMWAKHLAIG